MFFLINNSFAQNKQIDKTVIKNFDINKYLGKWYEIARYDHSFERGLVGVTATYSLKKNGKINVINSGYEKTLKGKKTEAIGKAKIPNAKIPAKLKVSFFWFFYAEYNILEIDKDYQWAIVGSNTDKYLWILSRTPQMEKETYNSLVELIHKRGYNTKNLIIIPQHKNHSEN